MTGRIIPADQWPEWADRHCWDADGSGLFVGVVTVGRPARGKWASRHVGSGIPMPAGWDWRVPVIRPDTGIPVSASAADLLKQAADVIRELQQCISIGRPAGKLHAHAADVLALIDGQARQRIDLAADHTGMRVDYSGLIEGARRGLAGEPGIAEMLRQLSKHLGELGRRWYAGDRKVVDEFLQLYCIESEVRAAVAKLQPTKGEGE